MSVLEKITNETFHKFKKLEGFDGPYRNQYLKGIALGPGIKKFKTLEEAIEGAKQNPRCGGITVSRQGYYTLRRKSNLYNSDSNNKFKSIEVTYVKLEDEPGEKLPEVIVKRTANYEIMEVKKIPKNTNPDSILEKIILQKQEYFYNIYTRKIYSLEGKLKGKLEKGKFAKV